ncbi:MAG: riboflavin synthase [Planctomycetota bacterium]|jgi:riboflavin synthase|nr:riboflavin synthase [Planctomycetota bacterium]
MFTGLVKGMGAVREVSPFGLGRRFRIELGALSGAAAIGQSMAVNGACLTITGLAGGAACFDAVSETVSRTNLGLLRPGDRVNLEPALRAGDALDGHIVQGHIDAAAPVAAVDASRPEVRTITIALPASISRLVAEKGSVAVDGVSLTVSGAGRDSFAIAVIPHTWENTTLSLRKPGDLVNVEVDVLARYAARFMGMDSQAVAAGLSETFLETHGFFRSGRDSGTG